MRTAVATGQSAAKALAIAGDTSPICCKQYLDDG